MKILVIDDDNAVLRVMENALTTLGHQVETASDGKAGLSKFNGGFFDLVITDLDMSDLNGHEVVEFIRRSDKNPSGVIAISGSYKKMESPAFDTFLAKPFSLGELAGCVSLFS